MRIENSCGGKLSRPRLQWGRYSGRLTVTVVIPSTILPFLQKSDQPILYCILLPLYVVLVDVERELDLTRHGRDSGNKRPSRVCHGENAEWVTRLKRGGMLTGFS